MHRVPVADRPGAWPATSNDTVPIGPVYDFLDHVVLDEDGCSAADGELCVRGAQRFDGYLDEPTTGADSRSERSCRRLRRTGR